MNSNRLHAEAYARRTLAILAVVVAAMSFSVRSRAQDPSTTGQWSPVMNWPIVAVHAHLLTNGKVLFYPYTDDSYLWDPATNEVTVAAKSGFNLFCTGHTFLADGRLFVAGGHIAANVGLANSAFYNAAAGTWTNGPNMNAGRWYPTNTMLANGDVLVTSGDIDATERNLLPQVYQRSTNTWRDLTGAQIMLDLYPFMHLAPNGKIFMSGPTWHNQYLDTTGAGAWTTVVWGNHYRDYGSSVVYADGKVLNVGGSDPPTASAEVIDLSAPSPSWRAVQAMSMPRRHLNATLLPDGKVLVTGGTSGPGFNNTATPVRSAEMWDPATETWTQLASHSSSVYRAYHSTALLLPDGRVLSAGGDDNPTAEIFSPPYLFKGARPTIANAPAAVPYGQTFFVETPDAAGIKSVTWIRLSSVTHAFNMSQRINVLSHSVVTGGLNVTAPSNPNLCPPGHYLLFILNQQGVPSIAKIVRVDTAANLPPPGPPPAPATLTAAAVSSSQINLNWSDTAGDETGFKVERSVDGVTFTEIATLAANTTTYANTGLAAQTTYSYRVLAFNGAGNSAWSNVASATTQAQAASIGAPANLDAATVSATQINLTWADNATNETGFTVERALQGSSFTVIATLGANVTSFSNTGLTPNTRYTYRVRAFNATLTSAYSNVANARTRPK